MSEKTEKNEKKKSWVTRYGSPETRKEIEYDDGDCPACVAAGSLDSGDVLFVEVETEEKSVLRRVEGVGRFLGFRSLACTIVSHEEADREIAPTAGSTPSAESKSGVGVLVRDLIGIGRMIFDPGYAAYEGARIGARIGEVYSRHDPCTRCGHGRLLHRRQAYVRAEQRAQDETLSETRCRHGHHQGGTPCPCERWDGVETPVPRDVSTFTRRDR